MCGSATEAMEVSSTSMKVASMTEIAISHGLKAGRASDMPPVPATVVLAIPFPSLRIRLPQDPNAAGSSAAMREQMQAGRRTIPSSLECPLWLISAFGHATGACFVILSDERSEESKDPY